MQAGLAAHPAFEVLGLDECGQAFVIVFPNLKGSERLFDPEILGPGVRLHSGPLKKFFGSIGIGRQVMALPTHQEEV
jgi:hypothetical protein